MSDPEVRLPSGMELIVLELLASNRKMYGLELVKASDSLKRGTVYVLLNRMEDKGYVRSRQVKEEGASGMPKRLYEITGLGERALAAWQHAQAVFADAPAFGGAS